MELSHCLRVLGWGLLEYLRRLGWILLWVIVHMAYLLRSVHHSERLLRGCVVLQYQVALRCC